MKKFPTGQYGRQTLRFHPAPFRAPLRSFAVLVFPWADDRVVICDIDGRGWCIPSGRVEAFESSVEAARREAKEEAGVELGCLDYIGCYQIIERREVRWADCYAAKVAKFSEITMPEESRGIYLARLDELEGMYHLWNDLTEQVFKFSREVIDRRCKHGLDD